MRRTTCLLLFVNQSTDQRLRRQTSHMIWLSLESQTAKIVMNWTNSKLTWIRPRGVFTLCFDQLYLFWISSWNYSNNFFLKSARTSWYNQISIKDSVIPTSVCWPIKYMTHSIYSIYMDSLATLFGVTLLNCLLGQVSNQLITLQQLNTLTHIEMVKMLLRF